ncbi:hypothetical protein CEXT_745211 [Caerostris extrusa]|uniref:Uncharacterized protein n=1 Tax=Caerostris extrusa TaxID=172846 RepID=A0AAV4R5K1_CAEEX|nr:hypothetical protein CEXT_745211 [Caerostris extrusa]
MEKNKTDIFPSKLYKHHHNFCRVNQSGLDWRLSLSKDWKRLSSTDSIQSGPMVGQRATLTWPALVHGD